MQASTKEDYFIQVTHMAPRTFFFTAADIRSLKRRINGDGQRLASAVAQPPTATAAVSTFVAVLALVWFAFARAKGLAAGDVAPSSLTSARASARPSVPTTWATAPGPAS